MSNKNRPGWTPRMAALADQEMAAYREAVNGMLATVAELRAEGRAPERIATVLFAANISTPPGKVAALAAVALVALAEQIEQTEIHKTTAGVMTESLKRVKRELIAARSGAWRDYTIEPTGRPSGIDTAVLCRSDDVCEDHRPNDTGRYLTLGEAVDWAVDHVAAHAEDQDGAA